MCTSSPSRTGSAPVQAKHIKHNYFKLNPGLDAVRNYKPRPRPPTLQAIDVDTPLHSNVRMIAPSSEYR